MVRRNTSAFRASKSRAARYEWRPSSVRWSYHARTTARQRCSCSCSLKRSPHSSTGSGPSLTMTTFSALNLLTLFTFKHLRRWSRSGRAPTSPRPFSTTPRRFPPWSLGSGSPIYRACAVINVAYIKLRHDPSVGKRHLVIASDLIPPRKDPGDGASSEAPPPVPAW